MQDMHYLANLSCCTDLVMPKWVMAAFGEAAGAEHKDSKLPPELTACHCPSPQTAAKAIPLKPPVDDEDSDGVPIPEASAEKLTTAEFFWRHAYRGLPVIIRGLGAMNGAWWDAKAAEALQCSQAEEDAMTSKVRRARIALALYAVGAVRCVPCGLTAVATLCGADTSKFSLRPP